MDKKHIITISGQPGSGKSTTADAVAKLLKYERFSSGDLMREIAKKRQVTIGELNFLAEKDTSIDEELDSRLRELGEKRDKLVIDSRLGFYWIPNSFKVYLDLDLSIAASRIFADMNENRTKSGETADSAYDVEVSIRSRLYSERKRYEALYGVNPYKLHHYDLIVDTSRNNPDSVGMIVYDNYLKWLKSEEWSQVVERVPLGYSLKSKY